MPDNVGSTFLVVFRGATVECLTLGDADAFKCADGILTTNGPCDQSPAQLDRVAEVLTGYGRVEAARVVAAIANRMRAVQFLVENAGIAPPKRSQ